MKFFWLAFVAAGGYLIGCINYSIIFSKVFLHGDIRSKGSGNAGSTNMLRSYGWRAGVVTLLNDFLKAFVATIGSWALFTLVSPSLAHLATALAGLCCAIGHCFPAFFSFRGGKGVAVGAVMILMTDYRCFLIALGTFLVLVLIFRYVSLGSVMAALSFPVSLGLMTGFGSVQDIAVFSLAVALAVLVITLHFTNIRRIFSGNERKLSFGKKK